MAIKIKKSEFKKLYDLACAEWKTRFDEFLKLFIFDDELEFEVSFIQQMEAACDAKQLKVFTSIFKDFLPENLFAFDTYSKVCKKLGEEELTINDFKFLHEDDRAKILAKAQIAQLERFFNQGWVPNWKDQSESKYYPYFEYKAGHGWVFDAYYFHCYYSYGEVAFYKDAKTAEFVGKTFLSIYKQAL